MSYLSFASTKFNNRLAFLVNCLSVVILVYCGVIYALRYWFLLDKIIITGNINHVTKVQLEYIAQNKLHGTFFSLDILELKREFQQLPWVYNVSVSREFPHTLVVKIEEYTPVARIGDDSLLATNGKIFNGAESDLNLPILYTDPAHAQLALQKAQQIQGFFNKRQDRVNKLWLLTPKLVKVESAKGLKITICEPWMNSKLSALDIYWSRIESINQNIKSINLCYKKGMAINSATKVAP